MGNIKKLDGMFKISPVKKLNEHFTLAECTVCGCGKNRNFSYIGKDVIEKKLYQLDYLPIVANIMEKEDGTGVFVGGHDYVIDDNLQWVPLTKIVGCVIADTFEFRKIKEYGNEVEYLVCKCVLYTEHIPSLMDAIYSDEIWFNQSMELDVTQGRPLEEDSNYYEILDFDFLKLCLLGKSDDPEYHTEPCFISSAVYPVEFAFDEKQFSQWVEKVKELFNACSDKCSEKGGNTGMNMEDIARVCSEFGISPEAITVSADMTEDALREQLATMSAAAPTGVEDPAKPFEFTYKQKHEAISEALPNVHEEDENGKTTQAVSYWLQDFDDSYAYVTRYTWDGDNETRDTGRFAYTYDTDANTATITGEMEITFVMYLTAEEKAIIEAERAELSSLRSYKAETEEAQKKAEYDAVIADFEDIHKYPEFESLLEHAYEFETVKALRKECCAIRGAHVEIKKADFSHKEEVLATAAVKHDASKKSAMTEADEFMMTYGEE